MANLSHLVTINEQSLTQALFLDQRMQGCQAFDLPPKDLASLGGAHHAVH